MKNMTVLEAAIELTKLAVYAPNVKTEGQTTSHEDISKWFDHFYTQVKTAESTEN